MIVLVREAATSDQIAQMLADWEVLIKVVVDTRRGILAGRIEAIVRRLLEGRT